jgi:RAP domain
VISGKLLGDLLWSIVQLRRCRMVTSATNYRKRESIQVLSDSVLGRIRDRIIAVAEDTSHYHLTMFPWALTSLGVWSIPAMDKVSEVLSRDYEKLSQREMAMFLYCLSLAAHPNSKQFADICRDVFEQKHDILIDPLIPWALNILGFPWHPHPEMRFKEFPFKNDETRLVRSSLVHMDIAKKLESIGLTLLNEVTVRGYSIDIAIDSKPKPIAIEVNGPVHYYQHCDGVKRLGGPSVLKARELKEEGWRVLNLDIKLYQKFPTSREKIHFLRKYIPRSVFAGVRT